MNVINLLRSSFPTTKRTTKLSWLPNNNDRLLKSDTRFFYLVFIRSLSHCSLNFHSSISTCLLPRFIIVIYTEFVHYTVLCYQDYITLRWKLLASFSNESLLKIYKFPRLLYSQPRKPTL